MKNNIKQGYRRFGRFSLFTLVAVYVLILVGGIVRSTGSGMGCPDWPKCFGNWVPPTEVEQLPENYKEIYSQKRAKKNVKFARYLSALGFEDTANIILNDKSILEEADFNKFKTWTEYINRVIGVLIGLFILVTFVLSIKFLKEDRTIFYIALAALLLVIFQGWIGSIVVSTNLVPWMVTFHMLIALVIVALLISLVYRSNLFDNKSLSKLPKSTTVILFACLATMVIQIVLGTQVREGIDTVAAEMNYENRGEWIASLGSEFLIHRSFSWLIVILHAILVFQVFKVGLVSKTVISLAIIIMLSVLTGVVMAYLAIPAVAQPIHLLLGTAAFGIQMLLMFRLLNSKKEQAALII